jgi:hypothetical protein
MGVGLELRENVAAALHPYQNCLKAARACGDQVLYGVDQVLVYSVYEGSIYDFTLCYFFNVRGPHFRLPALRIRNDTELIPKLSLSGRP